MIGADFATELAVYTPLTLVIAVVLASLNEANIRHLPAKALKLWAKILLLSAFCLVLITLAQDPWLIL